MDNYKYKEKHIRTHNMANNKETYITQKQIIIKKMHMNKEK